MATSKKHQIPLAPAMSIDWSKGFEFEQTEPDQVEQPPEKKRAGVLARMGDYGLTAVKGLIGVPELAVGLADIPTGGAVGKFLENDGGLVGFRPKQARAYLDEQYSDAQKSAFQKVHDADGVVDTAIEAISNPSVIGHAIAESAPSMLAGGVIGRGAMAVLPRLGGAAAGAIGEGAVSAGQTAEQIRQESADGRLTPEQAAIAGASGLATGGLSLFAGKLAQKLGIADVDSMLAGAAAQPASAKGLTRKLVEGALSEGFIEELPQSVQEQVAQNLATGKPLDTDVDQAAVLGALSGAAMGAGANLFPGAPASPPVQPPEPAKPAGPMQRAVNAGVDWENVAVPAAQPPAGPELAPPVAADGIPFEEDQRFKGAPIYPNGQAPTGEQFGTHEAANIALGGQGLMGSHEVVESSPGVFEVRPSAAPDVRMVQPGIYEAPPAAEVAEPAPVPRRPLEMPSQELLNAGVDPLTGEMPPPVPPAAQAPIEAPPADLAPGERPTRRAGDGTQRAIFESEGEARDYISEGRRRPRSAAIVEQPVQMPDGRWTLARPGEPGHAVAPLPKPEPEVRDMAAPVGDVMHSVTGKPFTNRRAALTAAKDRPGYEPAKVDGGFVLRQAQPVATAAEQNAEVAERKTADESSSGQAPLTSAPVVVPGDQVGDAPAPGVGTSSPTPPADTHATDSPEIDAAAHQAATSPLNDRPEPTDAQKEAGNYAKGHYTLKGGLNVSIENPKASMRRSKADATDKWNVIMPAHYGYIRGTTGADGDHVDLTIGDRGDNGRYWVINQNHPDGKFDEHKVITGVGSADEAVSVYKSSFANGFGDKVYSSVSGEMDIDEIKRRLPAMSKKRPVKGGQRAEQPAPAVEQPAIEQPAAEAASPEAAAPAGVDAGTPAADAGPADAGVPAAAEAGGVAAPAPAAPAKKRPVRFAAAAAKRAAEEAPVTAPSAAPLANEAKDIIDDVGEKIGGARKDTARKTGGRASSAPVDNSPGWRKRYVAMEDVRDMTLEQRPWHLVDKRTSKAVRGEWGRAQSFASKEAAEAAIPLVEVARNHRPVAVATAEGQRYTIMRDVSDRKRVQVVEQQFESREEALRYMRDHAVEIIETKTSFGEEILPKPENAMRTGEPRRTSDAKGEDFLQDFGLRAVEFGNWNNQSERQDVMNHAYDALADLADVLGLPPKAIGMGGQLGLAFGARGQGLSGARAHYELDFGTINLTKMSGAGSLAHEWFHALDHYFGRQDGKTPAERVADDKGHKVFKSRGAEGDMVSHGFSRESAVRGELRTAYKALIDTMMRKAERYVEDTQKVEKFVGDTKTQLADKLQALRDSLAKPLDPKYYTRNNGVATAEQLAEFDTIAERMIAGEAIETEWKPVPGLKARAGYRWTNDALEQLSAIYKSVRGRSGFDSTNRNGLFDDLRGYMVRYSQRLKMLAANQESPERERQVPTSFAMEAKSIDQGRASDYWATPHEMAARAFQSYVEDKVAEKGGASEFLTYGTNKVVPTPWGWKRPFPTGDERVAINKAFDKFIGEIKTSKDDAGNVTMFRVASIAQPGANGVTTAAIADEVEKRLQQFAHQPAVRIHDTAAGVLAGVADQGHVAGAVEGGVIHLFADALADRRDVQRTLFHELLHYGLRRFMTQPQFTDAMLGLYKRDAYIRNEADQWAKSEAGLAAANLHGEDYATARGVDEALATLAEPNAGEYINNSLSARLVKVISRWMANVAEALGFDGAAAYWRGIKNEEARKIIQEIFQRLRTDAPAVSDRYDFTADPAFRDKSVKQEVFDVANATGNTLAHYRGMGMSALGRRQIVELWSKELPQLPFYNDLVQRMDADKNSTGAEADEIATAWGKLKDERALAELMHDATLAHMDPAKDYSPGDSQPQYDTLKARFSALSPDAQALYKRARDTYADHYEAVKQAIRERLERSVMSSDARKVLLEKMDADFFKATKGVYFPLSRFGKYLVVVRGKDGKAISVNRAETINEATSLRTELLSAYPAAKGFEVGKVLKDKEFISGQDGPGKGFMDELFETLDMKGVSDDVKDAVGQLYLASLPDLSWAKHGIHRKGMPGFSQDARRAFAQNVFHGARYLAKLRYADQLAEQLREMQEHVGKKAKDQSYDSIKAQQVVDEMAKRHQTLMNPTANALSTALTSVGFVFHLGLSPASALVNLGQTALVAYPVMGAKWGYDKTAAALGRAGREAVGAKNDMQQVLTGEEREAFDKAVDTGVIDVTQAHDLAGIAQGEDAKVMWKMRPVMRAASFMFHHAEKFNRQITFVAAYRLARDAGASQNEAYEQAVDATYRGHFDYSASNRPRLMQGPIAKVLLLFKQFGQNMVYLLARQAYLSMKGLTQKERTEARKALAGLLVTHAAAAGALGLPLVGTLLAAASWLGSDDDEPWDAEAALRNTLAETFGSTAADVMAHGLSRLTPWDISGRVGLNTMILPDLQEGLEGRDLWKSVLEAGAGPVASIAGGALTGMSDIAKGRLAFGLEAMLPAALRGPVKAIRYATEGAKDRTGITILDEVGAAGIAGQALGLSPSEVRLATEGRRAIYGADKALISRRASLMAMAAQAQMAGDAEGLAELREEIAAFNERNPDRRIKPENLRAAVSARRRRIEQAQQGVYLPKNRRDALEAGRFATTE